MFVKLVAATLVRHPYLNSSLQGDVILLHRDINIGVDVALENGLIVPVVKNADQKGFAEIAVEVEDLVSRARTGKLTSADVKGGTFTISNLGPFGIEQCDAIINAPEAAILAIGATQPEAVPDEANYPIVSGDPYDLINRSPHYRWCCRCPLYGRSQDRLEAPILIAY